MAEIRFYHLTRSRVEDALPTLLGKTLERGWRAVVMARSEERLAALDSQLWTFNDRAFLPHGTSKDGHADLQPVWLTVEDENPNAATVLFLTDGAESAAAANFDLTCLIFDGGDEESVTGARQRWKAFRDDDLPLTYWQQNENGGWEKQAEHKPSAETGSSQD